ncbi:ORF3 [Paslahepevirus balayani]|uniref:ORF3 n=1 Tax=little egret hepatitis E virus TaxID=3070744 RepID=A0AA47YU11_9VIRU|nr:ORF3 [Paslahepevirus balayani]APA34846.1 ORF3 [little egret hepatitis E virus]
MFGFSQFTKQLRILNWVAAGISVLLLGIFVVLLVRCMSQKCGCLCICFSCCCKCYQACPPAFRPEATPPAVIPAVVTQPGLHHDKDPIPTQPTAPPLLQNQPPQWVRAQFQM